MIGYKDFAKEKKMLGLIDAPLESAVAAANKWVNANKIEVINVETFNASSMIGNGGAYEAGVRVWYQQR